MHLLEKKTRKTEREREEKCLRCGEWMYIYQNFSPLLLIWNQYYCQFQTHLEHLVTQPQADHTEHSIDVLQELHIVIVVIM